MTDRSATDHERQRVRYVGPLALLLTVGAVLAWWAVPGPGAGVAAAAEGSWASTDDPEPLRQGHAAVRLDDGRILVTGGNESEQSAGGESAEIYDPESEEWSSTDDMRHARHGHEMVKLADGRALVLGSSAVPAPPEIYDPSAEEGQRWADAPPSGLEGGVRAATELRGPQCRADPPAWCRTVLVVGVTVTRDQTRAVLFDPSNDTWTPTAAPDEAWRQMVRLDGTPCEAEEGSPEDWCGTVLGAQDGAAQVYNPAAGDGGTLGTGQWEDTAGFEPPRSNHALTALGDGRVLAIAGDDGGELDTAELYQPADDPAEAEWNETASLAQPRRWPEATLLHDGTVLVAGGADPNDSGSCGLSSAELFDPARDDGDPDTAPGAFVSAGQMTEARGGHTATPLEDGRALVVGGRSASCGYGSAELYTPGVAPRPPEVASLRPPKGLTDREVAVTITGSHFAESAEVTFGGDPATNVVVENSTRLTAVAPTRKEPGPVSVEVTTDQGGTSEAARFHYLEPAGAWTPVGDLPSLPDGDGVLAAALGDGRVLAVYSNQGAGRAALYDPGSGQSGTVDSAAAPPFVPNAVAPLADGGVLAVGAGGPGERPEVPGEAAVYKPDADAWQPVQTPPFGPRTPDNSAAFLLPDERVLVVVEGQGSEVYDPENDRWSHTLDQPQGHPMRDASFTQLADGRVLIAGGGPGIFSRTNRAQIFDPDDGQWRQAASMAEARSNHAGVALGDNKALVAGGYALYKTAGTEIFDADAEGGEGVGAWPQPTPDPLNHPRVGHTLTRLADGSVLAVGGRAILDGGSPLAQVERLRPGTGEWQPTAGLNEARSKHAAVALQDACGANCGNVVALGGGHSEATASVEVYTPRPQVIGVEPAQGVPGTEVTISGYGFAGADEVAVGGASAEFTVVEKPGTPDSPARITATVPPGLSVGEAPVAVTNDVPGASEPLTSQASPQAVFTVVEPEDGAADGDEQGGEDDGQDGDVTDLPGVVNDLAAEALSASEVRLTWTAVGDGAGGSAPAYVVKQSREPIATEGEFADAFALCGGVCEPSPVPQVGGDLSLTVLDLDPDTTYHYAVRARSGSGELGPVSDSVSVTTPGGTGGAGSGDGTGSGGDGSDGSELIQSVCGEDTPSASFTDRQAVPEAHRLGVDCAAAQGVVAGFADGSFRPQLGLRRDQMASFVARVLSAADVALPEPGEARFADVAGDSAHGEAIHRLAAAGIVSGGPGQLSADRYGPGQVIRRDQMASFLIRAGEYATGQQLASGGGGRFSDVPAGNVHAAAVDAAAALELAQGYPDGTYRPGLQVRRDQMATFVTRLLGSLNQGTLAGSSQ